MAYVSARLTELELKYMRLERHVEELSSVVADQQKTIDQLVKELGMATARLRDLGQEAPNAEKPPHY
jgi:SlyX protein